jgi:hypothetical protein
MDPADLDVNDEASENAVWVATEPRSGRFSGVETRSDVAGLSERFNELRLRGQVYLEVRMPDREYPVVTVGFREDYAVIHLFSDAEQVSRLRGDGTVPSSAVVEVPGGDDAAGLTALAALS